MNNFKVLANLTNIQLAFIIIVPVVVLLFLAVVLYFPIVSAYRKKNFQIHFYKMVYRVALDNDYYLINQFVFKISEIPIESTCEQFLEKLKNNYLYFDIDKKKRASKKESIEFFGEILRGKNIQYELIGGKNSLIGNYNEKINVDMKIQDKYYKIINFNDSNISTYIPTIKMWMMNALELKENKEELIFIVNEQIIDEKINTFITMLEKYGKVVKMSEFNDYFK